MAETLSFDPTTMSDEEKRKQIEEQLKQQPGWDNLSYINQQKLIDVILSNNESFPLLNTYVGQEDKTFEQANSEVVLRSSLSPEEQEKAYRELMKPEPELVGPTTYIAPTAQEVTEYWNKEFNDSNVDYAMYKKEISKEGMEELIQFYGSEYAAENVLLYESAETLKSNLQLISEFNYQLNRYNAAKDYNNTIIEVYQGVGNESEQVAKDIWSNYNVGMYTSIPGISTLYEMGTLGSEFFNLLVEEKDSGEKWSDLANFLINSSASLSTALLGDTLKIGEPVYGTGAQMVASLLELWANTGNMKIYNDFMANYAANADAASQLMNEELSKLIEQGEILEENGIDVPGFGKTFGNSTDNISDGSPAYNTSTAPMAMPDGNPNFFNTEYTSTASQTTTDSLDGIDAILEARAQQYALENGVPIYVARSIVKSTTSFSMDDPALTGNTVYTINDNSNNSGNNIDGSSAYNSSTAPMAMPDGDSNFFDKSYTKSNNSNASKKNDKNFILPEVNSAPKEDSDSSGRNILDNYIRSTSPIALPDGDKWSFSRTNGLSNNGLLQGKDADAAEEAFYKMQEEMERLKAEQERLAAEEEIKRKADAAAKKAMLEARRKAKAAAEAKKKRESEKYLVDLNKRLKDNVKNNGGNVASLHEIM